MGRGHFAPVPLEEEEEFISESRLSLLAGFKRHFRYKAAEGLLSGAGLRLLDYACDGCMARPDRPIDLWARVEHEVVSHGATPYLARLLFRLRQVQSWAIRGRGAGPMVLRAVQGPLGWVSRKTRNRLSWTAMSALEVALELWLALTASPQARWTTYSTTKACTQLQEELKQQSSVVWRFIVDRELEAPEEFSAIQTHRATLAVLRRQLAFVEQLGHMGGIEEEEQEALGELLEDKLAHLERRGPRWRPPSVTEVMRRQPFLEGAGDELLLWLRAYGEMRSFEPGQCIVPPNHSGGPGVHIILSGLVRVLVRRGSKMETHYVGVGSQLGLFSSLLARKVPGFELMAVYAQGNALGRGPMVLHLPVPVIRNIRQKAADGDPLFEDLVVNMHRQAGMQVFDWLRREVVVALAHHLDLALGAMLRAAQASPDAPRAVRRLQKLVNSLLPPRAASAGAAARPVAAAAAAGGPAAAGAGGGDAAAGGAPRAPGVSATSAAAAAGAGLVPGGAAGLVDVAFGGADGVRGLSQIMQGGEEGVAQLVADRAMAAADELRAHLCASDVVTLPPGELWEQSSSALVLSGSLTPLGYDSAAAAATGGAPFKQPPPAAPRAGASGGGGAAGGRGVFVSLRRVAGPCVMAWAPELFQALSGRDLYSPPQITFKAGPQGALLLVAPAPEGSSGAGGGSGDEEEGRGGAAGGPAAGGARQGAGDDAGRAAGAPTGEPSRQLRRMKSDRRLPSAVNHAHVGSHTM